MKRELLDEPSGPKYPQVKVKLVGEDGNAFSILGRCHRAMKRAGLTEGQWDEFLEEAKSGDYDHLLQTVMVYFTCDEPEDEFDCIHAVCNSKRGCVGMSCREQSL